MTKPPRLLSASLMLALCFSTLAAKDNDTKKEQHNPRHKNEQKAWPNSGKHKDSDANDEWKRQTEGHRPHDMNGDGVISRQEWPGNDQSFKQLDRDNNGVLDDRDREAVRKSKRDAVHR